MTTSMNASRSSLVKERSIVAPAAEEHKMLSTVDLSAGEEQSSYSKSNKTSGCEYQDSYSDDEDAVYVPFEY